jgi:hypothetical protein
MKGIHTSSIFLAAAVAFTAACKMAGPVEGEPAATTVVVSFTSEMPETRAAFTEPDGNSYPVLWQSGDKVKLFLNGMDVNPSSDKGVMEASISEDKKTAWFQISLPDPGEMESFNYGAVSPASAFSSFDEFSGLLSLTIPEVQQSSALSCDPSAMLLWAAAGPYGSIHDPVKLPFRHLTAYGKLTLTGLKGTLNEVELASERNLAGVYRHPSQTDPQSAVEILVPETPVNQIRIAATNPESVWFACAPEDWSGSTLRVTATTSEGVFIRSLTFPADRVMKPGSVASFTVDMSETSGKTDVFEENHIVFSFGAISDVHINSTTNSYATKFINALNQLKTRAAANDPDGLDAVVVAGDLTDQPQNTQVQIGYFKTLYERVLDPKAVPMIYTVGNHDANPSYWWTSNTIIQAAVMSQVLGADYFLTDLDNTMRAGYECRHNLVAGYHILSVTPTGTYPVTYPAETKVWLDATLQELTAADPERYIFFNTHPMIENTCYGSLLGTPMGIALSPIWSGNDSWATRDLTDILKKYPQVVTFGGHLHFPLHDPRSIWQGDFTSFGCGSVRYMAIENGGYQDMKSDTVMNDCEQVSDGWLIQLDRNGNMRATALDFLGNAVIGVPYEMPYPHADKSHLSRYGSNRAESNQAPVLDTSQINMYTRQVGSLSSTVVEWAKAQDDEFAHHYSLVLYKDGSYVNSWKYLADFYLHPQASGMKDKWSVSVGSLTAGTYEVKLTAYDSWDASATVTKSFTIEGPQPMEKGLYADIDFTGGTPRDNKGKVTVTNRGASIAETAVTHAGQSYNVPAMRAGASQYVECQFNEIGSFDEARAFMGEGFSIETMFVDREPGTVANNNNGIHGVFCGTQYGGWGLALRSSKVPYLVVGENTKNNYVILDASASISATDLTHVVCVYDPSVRKATVYINGSASASKSISGSFYPGDGNTYNRFCLGADISLTSIPDYPCTDMIITDAKFYTGALDATAVQAAYQAAVKALNQ